MRYLIIAVLLTGCSTHHYYPVPMGDVMVPPQSEGEQQMPGRGDPGFRCDDFPWLCR